MCRHGDRSLVAGRRTWSEETERSGHGRATIEILDPRALLEEEGVSETFSVGSSLAGKVVGLRLDQSWRSYEIVLDEWQKLLVGDGAIPRVLVTGERVGDEGERTRSDLAEWSRLIDVGVVGLGN